MKRRENYGLAAASLSLAGCARAPAFDVIGSFFPAWLVCLIAAILLDGSGRMAVLAPADSADASDFDLSEPDRFCLHARCG